MDIFGYIKDIIKNQRWNVHQDTNFVNGSNPSNYKTVRSSLWRQKHVLMTHFHTKTNVLSLLYFHFYKETCFENWKWNKEKKLNSRPVAFLKQTAPRTSERSELHEMYAASIVSFFKRRHFSGVRFPRGMERKFGSLFQFQAYPRMVLDPIHTPVQVAFGDLRMCIKCSFVIASHTSCVFIIFKTVHV